MKRRMKQVFFILGMSLMIILILGGAATSRAQSLPLNDYLSQVAGGNPDYRSAQEAYEGAKKRTSEKNVIFMPAFEAMYEEGRSEAPTYTPLINGERTDSSSYSVGISKAFSFGTQAKISYGRNYRDTIGAGATFVPFPEYYTVSPRFEIIQPLWRNGFGSEFRAQSDAVQAAQRLSLYQERARLDRVRLEAEATYNQLYFAREILKSRRESLDVNSKLFSWMRSRTANALAEDADLVQARAAKELSELELLRAEEEERAAARAFNTMRGRNDENVAEVLLNPIVRVPDKIQYDPALQLDSTRIVEHSLKAAQAQDRVSLETYKPTLELYGFYSQNGLAQTESGAARESWTSDHPIYLAGVRFKAPLYFWDTSDIRQGYRQEIASQDLALKKEVLNRERDQRTLVSNIQSLRRRFELAQSLLETQKRKLSLERGRHRRGRTTLFQVLQYEQDYLNATLNLVQYQSQLIQQINQYSLYRKE